jgi:hypothetical protein
MLKLVAAIVGFLIVGLSVVKFSGVALGFRTEGNIFTGAIGPIDVLTFLLVILVLIELSLFALIISQLQVE